MNCCNHGRRPNRQLRRGVTLIDLTITVLILGMLAAIAVPRFADALAFHRASAAAELVAADMLLAREAALATSADQTVSFEPSTNRYTVFPLKNLDHSSENYSVNLANQPYCVSIVSVDFGGTDAVTFDGFGNPATGGEIVVQSGSHQRTIAVDAETGKAAVQ